MLSARKNNPRNNSDVARERERERDGVETNLHSVVKHSIKNNKFNVRQ